MKRELQDLITSLWDGEFTRREFLTRALAVGLSTTAAADMLASYESTHAAGLFGKKLHGRIQIMVGYYGTGNTPAQIPIQNALARAFVKLHPGVTIDFLRVPFSDARTKLITLVAGGTPPDIVMPVGIYGTSLLIDGNMWLDLGRYFRRDGITLDRFVPTAIQAIRAKAYYGLHSNAVLGVPVGVNDHVLAYNEELFHKAGVKVPPASWHDPSWTFTGRFLDAAKALTHDKNGKHPGDRGFDPGKIVQFGIGHFFRETIFWAWGGRYYNPAKRHMELDSPASIHGIQFAADLINRYHVKPSATQVASLGAGAQPGSEEQFAWRAGKLAMIDMCSCDIRSPYGTQVPFTWRAGAVPAGPKRRFNFLNLDIGTIVKSGKNHDLAWEVLKYFAIDPRQEPRLSFDSYGEFPPLKATVSAFSRGIKRELPHVNPQVWQDGLSFARDYNESWFPAFAQINDLIGPAFDTIEKGAAAPPVMKTLQQQTQAKLHDWLLRHPHR